MNYHKKLKQYLQKDLINEYKIFSGEKYFSSGIFQNYLVFIPAKKYFSDTTRIYSSKSTEMSEENIENITKSNSIFAPTFVNHNLLPDINFNGHLFNK